MSSVVVKTVKGGCWLASCTVRGNDSIWEALNCADRSRAPVYGSGSESRRLVSKDAYFVKKSLERSVLPPA